MVKFVHTKPLNQGFKLCQVRKLQKSRYWLIICTQTFWVGSSKEWQACTTSNNGNIYPLSPLYIFALTSMSFSDLLFLKETIGGSLKICWRDGWFCIRCHFPIKTCLSFGTAGWYCVTKGSICFRLPFFCCSADVLSVNLTTDKSVSIRLFG